MRGYGHDGAGAVADEDVVADPDGDICVVDGIDCIGAGELAGLVFGQVCAVEVAFACGLFLIVFDGLFVFGRGDFIDEGVFGRHHHICCAKERIGARGEDTEFAIMAGDFEIDFGADAFADPV